jgi:hypothetical protein
MMARGGPGQTGRGDFRTASPRFQAGAVSGLIAR